MVAVGSFALAATATGGSNVGGKTTIGINADSTTISGKITSKKSACKKKRAVTVFRGTDFITSTVTNKKGKWRIRTNSATPFGFGKYFVQITEKPKSKFICKAITSKKKAFGDKS